MSRKAGSRTSRWSKQSAASTQDGPLVTTSPVASAQRVVKADAVRRAAEHAHRYLSARPGRLLIAYDAPNTSVARALVAHAPEDSPPPTTIVLDGAEPNDLKQSLLSSEKFLCIYNRRFSAQKTDTLRVIEEACMEAASRAYALADQSSAFFDVFQACPDDIVTLNAALIRILQDARTMRISTPDGTDLRIGLGHQYDWSNMDGLSEADFDLAIDLPAGEVATYSPDVNGTVRFTGALLGTIPIGRKYGAITSPIDLELRDGALVDVDAHDDSLQRDLEFCLHYDAFTHLVNEVALGTHPRIHGEMRGLYGWEEIHYGFHMGFGASLAQHNVERLTSQHLDLVFSSATVRVDDEVLFDGQYHLGRFPAARSSRPLRVAARTCCGSLAARR